MSNLYLKVRNWLEREEGQDLIEYALLVVFIAVIAVAGMTTIGNAIGDMFTAIAAWLGPLAP